MTDSTIALIERLKDRAKLKYMAPKCKCGKCQLVPITLLYEAATELTKLRAAMTEAARMLKHDYSHDDDGYGVAEYLERILGGGE